MADSHFTELDPSERALCYLKIKDPDAGIPMPSAPWSHRKDFSPTSTTTNQFDGFVAQTAPPHFSTNESTSIQLSSVGWYQVTGASSPEILKRVAIVSTRKVENICRHPASCNDLRECPR